jgi:hypothetical protein
LRQKHERAEDGAPGVLTSRRALRPTALHFAKKFEGWLARDKDKSHAHTT